LVSVLIKLVHLVTEKALKDLMKQRREKVEEIKKKTNYYSTRDLLQKYDDSSMASPVPLRRRVLASQPVPVTPQQPVRVKNGLPDQSSPNTNPLSRKDFLNDDILILMFG
jgi:hypothetical protein